jgi:glycosyltransferase involved in cell wall biosynthesis
VGRDKLVPWDIEHPFHPNERPPKSLRSQGPYEIFYVGSISEAKGVGDLIRALPVVLRNGIDVRCVLAGGGAIEPMRALARSHGVEDKVGFAGMIPNPEVLNRMSRADIVVVPSRPEFPEGFPLSMFEAIASRTPIVCSDHPVFRNVLRDKQNAVVFRAGDPASLAGALQRAIRDPELCHRLSCNAESAWDSLSGAANWRTLIRTWLLEGPEAPWIQQRVLSRQR